MRWIEVSADWNRYRGMIGDKWNFLSEVDLDEIDGDKGRLIEKIADRYGLTLGRAESWVDDYLEDLFREAA